MIFVAEYYRNRKKLSGGELVALFDKYDVWELAKKSYFIWHIESPENFVREIDHHVGLSGR
jgi:hypothetical protein